MKCTICETEVAKRTIDGLCILCAEEVDRWECEGVPTVEIVNEIRRRNNLTVYPTQTLMVTEGGYFFPIEQCCVIQITDEQQAKLKSGKAAFVNFEYTEVNYQIESLRNL